MDSPLVSIIVVSYNHEQFVEECLESIKNQSYRNIELIVADDASKDNSAQIIKRWLGENNISAKTNFHKNNTGLATTLNECIEFVSGKYIKLIAADDFLHPACIEQSVLFLETNSEKYGMVFTDVYTVNNNSDILQDMADYDALGLVDPDLFNKELLKGNRIAALSVLMKTSVLLETGLYDAKYLVEDYFRWLKIAEHYYIGYISSKLCYYRQHEANISKATQQRIEDESSILSMRFDKDGYAKDYIYKEIYRRLMNDSLSEVLYTEYIKYSYASKKLILMYKFPIIKNIFRIKNKFLKR